jgi:hypothetical protein
MTMERCRAARFPQAPMFDDSRSAYDVQGFSKPSCRGQSARLTPNSMTPNSIADLVSLVADVRVNLV